MRYLKSIFETNRDYKKIRASDFCEMYLSNYKIVGDEVNVDGEVRLFGKDFDTIPVKFGYVKHFIDVRNNRLESFEFLPEECGGNYIIESNPGIKGLLRNIISLMAKNDRTQGGIYTSEVQDVYRPIFNMFIKKCLEYDVWYDGQTIEERMLEAWIETKLKKYKEMKDAFFYGMTNLISLDDVDILEEHFNLNLSGDWVMELVDKLIGEIKAGGTEPINPTGAGINLPALKRRFYFKLFASIISQDEDSRIREVVSDTYDLSDIYDQAKSIKNMSDKQVDTLAELVKNKLTRTDENQSRDQSHDLFVFIGKDEFVKNDDDSYRKKLGIENFVKMNIYNPADLQSINMMKIRARYQMAEVYMIWMPKGWAKEDKDSYMPSEIPDGILKLIDNKKTRI